MTDPYHALSFGMRFNPTDQEAIALYLRLWLLGQPLPDTAGIIHPAEVYKYEPKDLAAAWPRLPNTHDRFFFTTCMRQKAGTGFRMKRTAGAGSWVTSTKTEVKNNADETIGYHEKLRYAYKGQSGKSEWLMDEYHCRGLDQYALLHDGKEERVLCRLYVSPNAKPGSVALQQSVAGDHLLVRGIQGPASTMAMALQQQRRPQEQAQAGMRKPAPQEQAQAGMRKPAPQVAGRQSPLVPAPMWSSATSKSGYVARQQTATGDHRLRVQEPAIMAAPRPQARPQQVIVGTTATPRGLALLSGQQQRRITVPAPMTTQQAPKRPAPPIAEPPHPKRMRAPALAPAPTRPAVNFLSAPLPQRQATKDKEADLGSVAEGQSTIQQGGHKRTIQQKACNDYTDDVGSKIIQKDGEEEDEHDEGDDDFARFLDDELGIAPEEETDDVGGKAVQKDGDEEDEHDEGDDDLERFLGDELEIAPEEETDDLEGKSVQNDGDEEEEQEEGDDDFARFLDDELEIAPEETEGIDGKAIEKDDDEEDDMSTLW